MKYITRLNTLGGFLYAFLILLFIRTEQDYLRVQLIQSAVLLLTGVLGLEVISRKFKVHFSLPGFRAVCLQLRAGWNIFISIAAINAYTTTRIFILGLMANPATLGFYSVAERIANACQTFPLDSFSKAVFPRLSAIYAHNRKKAFTLMRRIQRITTGITVICLPVIFIAAERIIILACGKPYPEAVISLRLLVCSVFFVAANAFRVQFLLVCGQTATYSRIHIAMALIGLPLIFLSVHFFSYTGAAVATIAIEAGVFIITGRIIKRMRFN